MKVALTTDLHDLGELARTKNVPILLAITQAHCRYCHTVREEILEPMLLSGSYTDKVLMREMSMDEDVMVKGFDGRTRGGHEVASNDYSVWVTPTLLFLGPDGRELSARILGVNTIEFYGFYVDAAISEALDRLRGRNTSPYVLTKEDIGR